MAARDRLASFQEDVHKAVGRILEQVDGEAAIAALERSRVEAESASLRERAAALEAELATAVRHKEMFRRALYTYLQERDGPAGSGAPTPETLARIRELVEPSLG